MKTKQMKIKHMRIFILWAVCALSVFSVAGAHAFCIPASHAILWSYPADNAVNVPTNTRYLWVLATNSLFVAAPPSVTINGEPLTYPQGYILNHLAPNTRYEVVVADAVFGEPEAPITLTFTTGDGPRDAAAPLAFSINSATKQELLNISPCGRAVLGSQTCFDSGPVSAVTLDVTVEGEEVIAWVIGSKQGTIVWPASCGAPTTYIYDQMINNPSQCFTLTGFDVLGNSFKHEPYCMVNPDAVEPDAVDTAEPSPDVATGGEGSGTCHVTAMRRKTPRGGTPWWMLLAAGGVAVALCSRHAAARGRSDRG
jgi:hypothetical protein